MSQSGWASHVPAACQAQLGKDELRGTQKVFTVSALEQTETYRLMSEIGNAPSLDSSEGKAVVIKYNDPKPQALDAELFEEKGLFLLKHNGMVGALADIKNSICDDADENRI